MIRAGIRLAGIGTTENHADVLGQARAAAGRIRIGQRDSIRPEQVRVKIISDHIDAAEDPGAACVGERNPVVVHKYRNIRRIKVDRITSQTNRGERKIPLQLRERPHVDTNRIGITTTSLVATTGNDIAGILQGHDIDERTIVQWDQRITGDLRPGRCTRTTAYVQGDNRTDTNRSIRTCIDIGHIRIETDIVERARFIRRGIVIRGEDHFRNVRQDGCPVGWQGRSYRCPGSAGSGRSRIAIRDRRTDRMPAVVLIGIDRRSKGETERAAHDGNGRIHVTTHSAVVQQPEIKTETSATPFPVEQITAQHTRSAGLVLYEQIIITRPALRIDIRSGDDHIRCIRIRTEIVQQVIVEILTGIETGKQVRSRTTIFKVNVERIRSIRATP